MKPPPHAVFSNLPSLHLSSVQILLSTLFSNTLSPCFSLNVRDQVSRPYSTTGNIIVFYVLSFMFLDSRREFKRFWTEWYTLAVTFPNNLIHPPCPVVLLSEKYGVFCAISSSRSVDNIKINLREIEWVGTDWIVLAQDRDQWRALVNTVLKLRVP
jgi:hypothetical protein